MQKNSKHIRCSHTRRFLHFGSPTPKIEIAKICVEMNREKIKKEDTMPNRKRPIIMRLAVTEEEKNLIEEKMKILGTHNFGAYARKMLIDGYIIKVDYSEQRKLAAEVNKIGVNINQICKRINSTSRVYSEDVTELRM